VDLHHSYSKGITHTTMVSKVIVVNKQWSWFPLLQQCVPMTSVPTVVTTCFNNDLVPNVTTMCTKITLTHTGCLVPRKNMTDMDGPIRCSSLKQQCEEQLKTCHCWRLQSHMCSLTDGTEWLLTIQYGSEQKKLFVLLLNLITMNNYIDLSSCGN
jgi:hypothetical protein